jgi:hypothetical protein
VTRGTMKPRKKTVKQPKRLAEYCISTGTPREPGVTRSYTRDAEAKRAAMIEIDKWVPWCERYNKVGILALESAKERINLYVGGGTLLKPYTVEALFDEHSGMTLVIRMWKT